MHARRSIIRWPGFVGGVENELIPPSVLQGLQAVTPLRAGRTEAHETPPVLPVPDEVIVVATLPYLRPVVRDMVALHTLLGCRPDELCRIRFADIDRTGDVWRYDLAAHKTRHHGKDCAYHIGPRGQEILNRYVDRDPTAFIFSPRENYELYLASRTANRKTPLSCGNAAGNRKRRPKRPPGERYTPSSYSEAVRSACKRAGVAKWSPGQLRHTQATRIRDRWGLEYAQVCLNHSRIETTQRYAETDHSKAIEVARAIG